jgi:hypothetical protein
MSSRGKVDRTAIVYILGGIPAMTLFFIGLFILVHLFNIPA